MNTCGSTAITRASEFWKVCRYEAIGELDEDVEDYDAALISLPAEINGKKVFGVEDGQYIVGGELARYDDRVLTYAANEIDLAVQWLKAQHFKVDDNLIHELRRAVE